MEKMTTLLQIAFKANKLVLGHDPVLRGLYKNRVQMVLYADDLSDNSFSSINNVINKANKKRKIDMIKYRNKDYFYQIFGKNVGVVGILDNNFKKGMMDTLTDHSKVQPLNDECNESILMTEE